jgi:hypothetical protein
VRRFNQQRSDCVVLPAIAGYRSNLRAWLVLASAGLLVQPSARDIGVDQVHAQVVIGVS